MMVILMTCHPDGGHPDDFHLGDVSSKQIGMSQNILPDDGII